jgi:hypothetical protein
MLDYYVLAFDVAGLAQPPTERSRRARAAFGRSNAYDPDHRQRGLLRRVTNGHPAVPPTVAIKSRRRMLDPHADQGTYRAVGRKGTGRVGGDYCCTA